MRILALAPYKEGTDAQSSRIFVLLYRAVFQNERETVGNDKQATRRLVRVMDALEALGERITSQGEAAYRLPVAGAKLALEDMEFTQLQKLWDSYRGQLPVGFARDVVAVDEALDGAADVTAAELAKKN